MVGTVSESSVQGQRSRRARAVAPFELDWPVLAIMAAILGIIAVLGGSSRADTPGLIILRPLSVVLLAWGLLGLDREWMRAVRVPLALLAAFAILTAAHLIPLPPSVWQALPNRALLTDIAEIQGFADRAMPLSVAPLTTWNALFSTVPVFALLLAMGRFRHHLSLVPFAFLAVAAASVLLGMLQVASSDNSILYINRFASYGSPTGLLANRNHQGAMLAACFPALAAVLILTRGSDRAQQWRWGTLCGALVLLVTLLMLGSRIGIVVAAVAMLLTAVMLWPVRSEIVSVRVSGRMLAVAGAVLLVAIVLVALYFGQSETLNRIAETDPADEVRLRLWGPMADLARAYAPWGSGIGSFVQAYQVAERPEMLTPSYINHAHNDWLEMWMTAGIPGLLLLGAATLAWALLSWRAWRGEGTDTSVVLARLGSAWVLVMALASVTDYPLRTPLLAGMHAIAWVLLAFPTLPKRGLTGDSGGSSARSVTGE